MSKSSNKDAFIEEFKARKSESEDYWNPIYEKCKKHKAFTLLGRQFEDYEAKKYGLSNPMQPNLLLTYANYIANQTLETDYIAKVFPNGYGATEQQAEARQAVLMGQQRMGDSAQIYNYARRDQVTGGISYTSVLVDYADPRGFGKTLKDHYEMNTFDVYPSPYVQTSTFSDSNYWIIKKVVPKSKWKKETGQSTEDWGDKKKKTIWYYWTKIETEDREYLVGDGSKTKLESEFKKKKVEREPGVYTDEPELEGVVNGEDGRPLSRDITKGNWMWYKIDEDFELLDEVKWKGSLSPVVACTGRRAVEGDDPEHPQVEYQGATQFAETPQKMYSIIANIIALRLGRSPYERWRMAFESLLGKEFESVRKSALEGGIDILYRAFTKDGKPIPEPKPEQPYILDPLLIQLQQDLKNQIQIMMGIFESNLGEKSNEQSGVAIRERAAGGQTTIKDLEFNFMEYVQQVGRVKLDLIPKYLTAPQQVAFVDKNDKATIQWINTQGGIQFNPNEEYNLSVEARPVSETARQEESEFLVQAAQMSTLIAQNPQAMAMVVRSHPGKAAQEMAEMLKGNDPRLQQAMAQIGQLQQQLDQTTNAAKAKIMEDSIKQESLNGIIKMLRQQIQLIRAANQADKAATEADQAQSSINPVLESMDKQLEALRVQIDKEEADTNRLQAYNEAARIKKETIESAFSEPDPSRLYPIKS